MDRPEFDALCKELDKLAGTSFLSLVTDGIGRFPVLASMLRDVEGLREQAEAIEFNLQEAVEALSEPKRLAMRRLFDTHRAAGSDFLGMKEVRLEDRRPSRVKSSLNTEGRRAEAAMILQADSWDTLRMRKPFPRTLYFDLAEELLRLLRPEAAARAVVIGPVPMARVRMVGRADQLDRLVSFHEAQKPGVSYIVVVGEPGTGKARLVAEYVAMERANRDLIVWIDAESSDDFEANLITATAALERELAVAPVELDGQNVRSRFRELLERAEVEWLLVVSDVAGPDVVHDLLPLVGTGAVVLTSTWQTWERRGFEEVLLRPLESDHAKELLLRTSGVADDAGAERLAEQLGHLPLPLLQAGAYLADNPIGYDAYIELLSSPSGALLDDDPGGARRSIAAAVLRCFERACEIEPASAMVGNFLAVVAPQQIPTASLVAVLRGVPSDEPTLAHDAAHLERSIATLRRVSVIERDQAHVQMSHLTARVLIAALHREGELVSVARTAVRAIEGFIAADAAAGTGASVSAWAAHRDHAKALIDRSRHTKWDPGAGRGPTA